MVGGISTIFHPSPYPPSSFFGIDTLPKGGDVTPIKWELGFILIFISILLFFSEYRKQPKPKPPQYTKCPKCKEVFNYNELKDGKCKNCKDVDTVDLEEYFKKYPEELEEKEKV
jgi:hypothetical protein